MKQLNLPTNPVPFSEAKLTPALYLILSTAMEILHADKGTLQFYDERENTLKILAHIGFSDEFLSHFKAVTPGMAACGAALKRKERVIIEDVFHDTIYSHLAPTFKRFGYSAVQSTPLLDSKGKVFGMLSTHFAMPRRISEYDLASLDAYLRKAVPWIERKRETEYKPL